MSEADRLAFLDTIDVLFPAFFSFCVSHAQEYPELAGDMYNLLLVQKGMVGSSIRALRVRIRAESDQRAIALLDELQHQRTLLSNLRRASGPDAEQQFDTLKTRIGDIERELVRHSATFAGQSRIAGTGWTAVRDALEQHEGLGQAGGAFAASHGRAGR